jgi:hypothetical protein
MIDEEQVAVTVGGKLLDDMRGLAAEMVANPRPTKPVQTAWDKRARDIGMVVVHLLAIQDGMEKVTNALADLGMELQDQGTSLDEIETEILNRDVNKATQAVKKLAAPRKRRG